MQSMTTALERAYAKRRPQMERHKIYLESPRTIQWLEQSIKAEHPDDIKKCKELLAKVLKAAKSYEKEEIAKNQGTLL